ncbi:MAG: aminotransferase class V-fold PLP-dependent enzyme [Oligoflexia bacterium]|nr:aminotransferase class V-fold PLP-dependent enzyme [Oligoflexia bacterium]
MNVKRNILLNPGPATTSDSVKMSQVVPDICPREEEFANLVDDLRKKLTSIAVSDSNHIDEIYDTVFIGGSGTAILDGIISTVTTGKIVIINNGAYGKRAIDIAQSYNLDYEEFKSSESEAINLHELDQYIGSLKNKPKHLYCVHHETTTGLLNDLEELGKIAKAHKLEFIVDGISSYAAIPIDMEKMNISFLAATSNKNIQGMAGIAFCVFNKEALLTKKDYKAPNYYLNILNQYLNFQNKNQLRFTPPVQTFYALEQAVEETFKEGVENRYQRYSDMWTVLNKGLLELGFELLISEENSSKLMTTIFEPKIDKYSFKDMHDYFYQKGITIYPGKVSHLDTFRIANIGELTTKDIILFLEELKNYLDERK